MKNIFFLILFSLAACTPKEPSYEAPPGPIEIDSFKIFADEYGVSGSSSFSGKIDPDKELISVKDINVSYSSLSAILKDNLKKRRIVSAIVSVDDQNKLDYLKLNWLGGDELEFPYFEVSFTYEVLDGRPAYSLTKWKITCDSPDVPSCKTNLVLNPTGDARVARTRLTELLDTLIASSP